MKIQPVRIIWVVLLVAALGVARPACGGAPSEAPLASVPALFSHVASGSLII